MVLGSLSVRLCARTGKIAKNQHFSGNFSALNRGFSVCGIANSRYGRRRAERSCQRMHFAKWGMELMIRSELIQKIADENPHLYQRDVERIVNTIFDEIIEAMARGDRVELRGFGAFSVKQRDARTGRNPRTGESVQVEEKHVPFFKTGKLLRDRLNGK